MNTVLKTAESEQSFSDEPLSEGESSLGSEPMHRVLLSKIVQLIRPYLFIFNRRLLLLLFSFGIIQVAQTSSSFLTQYISTRFTWTLARAHFLTSFHMAITIPVFLFLLPFLSNKVLHSLSLPRRDLQVARFSDIALTLGSLGIGLSPSIVLLIPSICLHATGAGFSLVTRSLVTALVKREETARLYSAIELMQLMGSVLGSLCFTNAFNSGLRMSEIGAGLVWMLASLLYALVGIALAFVRV
jgi:hypothetical protein